MNKTPYFKTTITYLLITGMYFIYEFLHELGLVFIEETLVHTVVELFIVTFSFLGLFIISKNYFADKKDKEKLHLQLRESRSQLESISERMRTGKSEFIKLINWQFEEWGLSDSEKEIGLLLLKGLSFEEISSIRNTSSKTVQKQATSIYAKSGLRNRNEFAAWFLEDLL